MTRLNPIGGISRTFGLGKRSLLSSSNGAPVSSFISISGSGTQRVVTMSGMTGGDWVFTHPSWHNPVAIPYDGFDTDVSDAVASFNENGDWYRSDASHTGTLGVDQVYTINFKNMGFGAVDPGSIGVDGTNLT